MLASQGRHRPGCTSAGPSRRAGLVRWTAVRAPSSFESIVTTLEAQDDRLHRLRRRLRSELLAEAQEIERLEQAIRGVRARHTELEEALERDLAALGPAAGPGPRRPEKRRRHSRLRRSRLVILMRKRPLRTPAVSRACWFPRLRSTIPRRSMKAAGTATISG